MTVQSFTKHLAALRDRPPTFGQAKLLLLLKRIESLHPQHPEVAHVARCGGQAIHDRCRGHECIIGKGIRDLQGINRTTAVCLSLTLRRFARADRWREPLFQRHADFLAGRRELEPGLLEARRAK